MLDWEWRKRNIIFELGLWSADVMCFQVITLPGLMLLLDKEQAIYLFIYFLFLLFSLPAMFIHLVDLV